MKDSYQIFMNHFGISYGQLEKFGIENYLAPI